MATTARRAMNTNVGELIQERSQAIARRLGVTTKVTSFRKSRCNRAKQAYALAEQAWIDAGRPSSGTLYNALQDADIDVFIYCELP